MPVDRNDDGRLIVRMPDLTSDQIRLTFPQWWRPLSARLEPKKPQIEVATAPCVIEAHEPKPAGHGGPEDK